MILVFVMEIMLKEGTQLVIPKSIQDRKLMLGDQSSKRRI
jgi:hypothetical protein